MNRKVYKISSKLGKNIKIQRIKKDYSQEQLANKSGISLTTYGAIENGKSSPKIETIANIAEALGIELYKLFMFEE